MSFPWGNETALAVRAVVEGGRIALERPPMPAVRNKGSLRDVVTSTDLSVDDRVRGFLSTSPYRILSEESHEESNCPLSEKSPVWIVDPIDGTVNYFNGLDYYAVSVGLCCDGNFLLGAVCMPGISELFCTFGKDHSLFNGRTLVHVHRAPQASLVAGSFSGMANDPRQRQREYQLFGTINDTTRGCLRLGSAASNICLTASNRLQAAYGLRAKIWDVAASLAVAVGAGCRAIVAWSDNGLSIDYIVGSRDTVTMIHGVCVTYGLMEEKCRSW